uniref:NADH dehydrogenase subunit 3 n=1 Tax=Pylorgus sordidus TaxID=3089075 RepID=UPI002A837B5C|nr:NADH dehydrogenase subunit 3 [Pylorgus sordidus]WOW98226.1 NADH dehydrogenase subunit 3 [Pylorgus sordidus]
MMKIMLSIILAIFLSSLIMITCYLISKKSKKNREKLSPFECGFDPKSSARTSFSIQFFLIAVLFLIFDIEIVILIPTILTLNSNEPMNYSLTMTMFMLTLILGLVYEWKNNMLEWAK